MKREFTDEERAEIELALEEARVAQHEFWDALGRLEGLLTPEDAEFGVELNLDDQDLDNFDVDDVIRIAQREPDPEDCTCADRSWYGPEHDTACPLEGPRE